MLFIYKNWDCTIKIFQTYEITAVTVPYVTYIPSTLSYSLYGQCLLMYIYSNYLHQLDFNTLYNQSTDTDTFSPRFTAQCSVVSVHFPHSLYHLTEWQRAANLSLTA